MKNGFGEKIIDLLMFRETDDESDAANVPVITTGSIVWGLLLRSFIIVFLSFLLISYFQAYQYWWYSGFFLWLFAAYPAYRQYQSYSKKIEIIEEETLCGSCRNFDPSNQMCKIYDEHVSSDYIPCEGQSWEPKTFEDR